MAGAIRAGVVGLGYFGSFHARHYAKNPDARLVGVVDADRGRAEAKAAELGTEAFTDHRALIGKVDAVSIAAPTSLHHDIAADFIDAGVHVLIEKPITDDSRTARDIVRRAAARRVICEVGHIERFSPTFRALQERASKPSTVKLTRVGPWTGRAGDVDVILDLMIHDIDLALALIRSPVRSVQAVGMKLVTDKIDFAVAYLDCRNGTTAILTAGRGSFPKERTVRVEEGGRLLHADLTAGRIQSLAAPPGEAPIDIAVPARDALGDEIAAFLRSVATRRSTGVSAEEGLDALLLAEMIRSSINRHGAPVEGALEEA
ncbi:MAG: Gfo/Idh/MocA family oxidoreductase [Bauldia sp.]|nr:Gfo/Idh/MocA family oxidoreductase [Bauldia sp.]